jgi:hypothetical protein
VTREVQERLRRLPRIRRARGFRLYTHDGRRILDLWQAGGRAILGHRGARVVTRVKTVLERGVLVAVPTPAEHRLVQSLGRLFADLPNARFAVYESEERAVRSVARALGLTVDECAPREPVAPLVAAEGVGRAADAVSVRADRPGVIADGPVVRWRPFLTRTPYSGGWSGRVLFPVLPAGGLWDTQAVVYPADLGVELESDLLPEPVLVALTAACDALAAAPELEPVSLRGFASAGPYLVPMPVLGASPRRDYDEMFDRFLGAGILLSPDCRVPSIYPAELSDGERALLRAVAREV